MDDPQTKQPVSQLILLFFLVALATLLIAPSIQSRSGTHLDPVFLSTNALIGTTATWMILRECRRAPYSLNQMHWVFQYAFFFVAPLVQYLEDEFPWGRLSSADIGLLQHTNFVILLWQAIWIAVASRARVVVSTDRPRLQWRAGPGHTAVLLVVSVLVLIYLQRIYGWDGLLTRGARSETQDANTTSEALQVVLTYGGRVGPIVLSIAAWWRWKALKSFGAGILLIFALTLTVVTSFPVSTTRFWSAAVVIGLAVTLLRVRRNALVYAVLVGLNVIFPVLGALRYSENFSDVRDVESTNLFAANLVTPDYDAFAMLAHTIDFVGIRGATYGQQLLTSILFFVPRSAWSGKSVGSGYVVGQFEGFGFLNVSSPLPAEGLINFGLAGVAGFAAAAAALSVYLDRRYWSDSSWGLRPVYPFWLGMMVFCLRGDLLSAMSFLTGLTAVFWLLSPRAGHASRSVDSEKSIVVTDRTDLAPPS